MPRRLVIRDVQLEALRAVPRSCFADELAEHLLRASPALAVSPGPRALRSLIGDAVERAGGYGLKRRPEVLPFVLLSVQVAPRFDLHPDLLEVLRRDDLPPVEKVARLLRGPPPRDWFAIAAHPACAGAVPGRP